VQSSKGDLDRSDGAALNMYSVALRSMMDIAINEIKFRDLHPSADTAPSELTLIEPRVDIHTVFSLYPAFVRSRMAYGWMCAADTLAPPADPAAAERARAIADRISVLRYAAARLECWQGGHPIPPTMVTVGRPAVGDRTAVANDLAAMKEEIRALVAERGRIGAAMPAGTGDWDDPNRWWFGREVHPWSSAAAVDEAGFVSQSVPASLPVGETASVSVAMRNHGTTTWDPAAGYALGSQEPQDNTTWGTARVPLAAAVRPGDTVTFTFTIRAPVVAGSTLFCWRMLQENVRWFGDTSTAVSIAVTPAGEPLICASLRTQVATIDGQIEKFENQLNGEVRHDGPINKRLTQLRLDRGTKVGEMATSGCTL